MPRAVVSLSLLAVAAVLASAPAAAAHGIYSGQRNSQGYPCCDDMSKDCVPTDACWLPGGKEGVVADGRCQAIPPEAVLPSSSPDGQLHVCTWGGRIRCVWLPGTT